MKLTVTEVDIGTETPTVLLNRGDADELGVNPLDRIIIRSDTETETGIVEVTERIVDEGMLGATEKLRHLDGDVDVSIAPKPGSVSCIRRKLDDQELNRGDIRRIVKDVDHNMLSDIELGAYVSAIYCNGLSMEETTALSEEMAAVGGRIDWTDDVVADKHSVGGVAGNRVTPVVVSIVAAAGVKIPKTSSRAITSPAGTADTVEVFCPVELSIEEMREVVDRTNGCMVWGGSVDLSPVDDRIIRAEHPLSIDPEGQVIASVLSKKKSAGSTHLLLDVPYGEGAKVGDLPEARRLARDFKQVAEHMEIQAECTITRGGTPIGRGIGPVLEARDVLQVLLDEGPEDLRLKSLKLGEILLEMSDTEADAVDLMESGAALKKFREIVEAQGGDPSIEVDDLEPGALSYDVEALENGFVTDVDNQAVSAVARRAGAPNDEAAGLYLEVKQGDEVKEGDVLYRVYAMKQEKLQEAVEYAESNQVIRVGDKTESLVERV